MIYESKFVLGKCGGGQSAFFFFLASAISQLSSAQNNPYAEVAYFGVS